MGTCYSPDPHKVPEHLQRVDTQLVNWARWSRDGQRTQVCGSLESRYQTEFQGHEVQSKIPPDQRNALKVQLVVSRLPLVSNRLVLHYWYIHNANARFIQRKLQLANTLALENLLNQSRTLVKNALEGM